MWYINVYRVSRAFGGHEEGGWYYDDGTFIQEAGQTPNEAAAQELKNKILEHIKKGKINFSLEQNQMGMNPYDGADPSGYGDDNYLIKGGKWGDEKIKVYVQNHKGRDFPEERQYYE
jgi:hypothetical protein